MLGIVRVGAGMLSGCGRDLGFPDLSQPCRIMASWGLGLVGVGPVRFFG